MRAKDIKVGDEVACGRRWDSRVRKGTVIEVRAGYGSPPTPGESRVHIQLDGEGDWEAHQTWVKAREILRPWAQHEEEFLPIELEREAQVVAKYRAFELEEDRAAIERVNAMIDTGRVTVLERLGPFSFRGSIRDGVIVSPSNPDAEPGKVATIFESTTFETEEDK